MIQELLGLLNFNVIFEFLRQFKILIIFFKAVLTIFNYPTKHAQFWFRVQFFLNLFFIICQKIKFIDLLTLQGYECDPQVTKDTEELAKKVKFPLLKFITL